MPKSSKEGRTMPRPMAVTATKERQAVLYKETARYLPWSTKQRWRAVLATSTTLARQQSPSRRDGTTTGLTVSCPTRGWPPPSPTTCGHWRTWGRSPVSPGARSVSPNLMKEVADMLSLSDWEGVHCQGLVWVYVEQEEGNNEQMSLSPWPWPCTTLTSAAPPTANPPTPVCFGCP